MTWFVVYGHDSCPYCKKAVAVLESAGEEYRYIRLESKFEREHFMEERGFDGAARTFPKVYEVDAEGEEHLVGGYDELEEKMLGF